MARAAVPGRLSWRVATVKETRDETATARTLTLDVPGWPGHLPGQHVAVKLTADDGYSAQRDYSIAGAPEEGRLELTVQRLDDGEVSPVPGRRRGARRPVRGARPDRRLVRLARRRPAAPAAARGRLRHRPADVHDPHPRAGGQPRPRPADLQRPHPGRRHLRERASRTCACFTPHRHLPLHARTAIDAGRPASALHGPPERHRPRRHGLPPAGEPGDLRLRPVRLRGNGVGPAGQAGHPPGTIKTERFGPT